MQYGAQLLLTREGEPDAPRTHLRVVDEQPQKLDHLSGATPLMRGPETDQARREEPLEDAAPLPGTMRMSSRCPYLETRALLARRGRARRSPASARQADAGGGGSGEGARGGAQAARRGRARKKPTRSPTPSPSTWCPRKGGWLCGVVLKPLPKKEPSLLTGE